MSPWLPIREGCRSGRAVSGVQCPSDDNERSSARRIPGDVDVMNLEVQV